MFQAITALAGRLALHPLTVPVMEYVPQAFTVRKARHCLNPALQGPTAMIQVLFHTLLSAVPSHLLHVSHMTSAVGLQSISNCRNCTGGLHCPDYNMTSPGGSCSAGKTTTLHMFM